MLVIIHLDFTRIMFLFWIQKQHYFNVCILKTNAFKHNSKQQNISSKTTKTLISQDGINISPKYHNQRILIYLIWISLNIM